jgi:hypothetical protein
LASMAARTAVAIGLVLLCGTSCGRVSHETEGDVPTTAAGVPGMSGSGQGGDSTSRGGKAATEVGGTTYQGDGDPGQEATCMGSLPTCVVTCESSLNAMVPDCIGHEYVCPKPSFAFESCPDDACGRRTDNCCSPTGHRTVPDCAADGTIGQCPEGYALTTGTCLPQGVDIHSCSDLQSGEACTDAELVCYTNKCGRNCYCQEDDGGKLAWLCFALPC